MAKGYNTAIYAGALSRQKQKLLILEKIMMNETDEEHSLTGAQIISRLAAYGIKAERKTIYDDIATLQEHGLDIVCEKIGHSNTYHLCSRVFQDEELYVLADAVSSSVFLTQKKSNELIEKLKTLTSKYKAADLKRSIYVANRAKTYNEAIYYSINTIHRAIRDKKQICFNYSEYNLEKRTQLRHGGELYYVSPYYLIWENDKYYLICYCSKHEKICRYRIDRMSKVVEVDRKRRTLNMDEIALAKNLRATYDMYGGEPERVKLELANDLINVIIDRYGTKIKVDKASDETFYVTIDAEISPTFWGWLFTFGNKARVVSPEHVAKAAKLKAREILKCYD